MLLEKLELEWRQRNFIVTILIGEMLLFCYLFEIERNSNKKPVLVSFQEILA